MAGPTSLKALAQAVLRRDTTRDSKRDRGPNVVPRVGPAVGQAGTAISRPQVSSVTPVWDAQTVAAVEWFMASAPPAAPFVMVWNDQGTRPAVTITDPARFWRDLRTDIAVGPGIRRDTYGAVRNDLRRLYAMFGLRRGDAA